MTILVRHVEVDGRVVDVVVDGDRIGAIGAELPGGRDWLVVEGDGGALIPGLWDHHIHLVALAAARRSVTVGPPEVDDLDALAAALAAHRPTDPAAWVRAVGYHESVAGSLDRHDLDRLLPGVPVRLQHRSGAMWVLSSEAITRLGIEGELVEGLERGADGRLTGRVYGLDHWLRDRVRRVDPRPAPDLDRVGRELAALGVVGVTDATPYEEAGELDLLARAVAEGLLPQRVVAMGGPPLVGAVLPAPLVRGPVKLWLADHALPSLDEVRGAVAAAHDRGRPVAVHCVTRASLALVIAALDDVGSVHGDRIEHGAVVPPDLAAAMHRHGLTVVTQPNFVAERGDRYLVEVDPDDRPHLYPCRSLLDAGIPVGGSTDAPFGQPDPWRAIEAAVDRRTAGGVPLGADEAVPPRRALELFLTPPHAPGGSPRRIAPGATADLCLLDAPLAEVLGRPGAARVRATMIGGRIVHQR